MINHMISRNQCLSGINNNSLWGNTNYQTERIFSSALWVWIPNASYSHMKRTWDVQPNLDHYHYSHDAAKSQLTWKLGAIQIFRMDYKMLAGRQLQRFWQQNYSQCSIWRVLRELIIAVVLKSVKMKERNEENTVNASYKLWEQKLQCFYTKGLFLPPPAYI